MVIRTLTVFQILFAKSRENSGGSVEGSVQEMKKGANWENLFVEQVFTEIESCEGAQQKDFSRVSPLMTARGSIHDEIGAPLVWIIHARPLVLSELADRKLFRPARSSNQYLTGF